MESSGPTGPPASSRWPVPCVHSERPYSTVERRQFSTLYDPLVLDLTSHRFESASFAFQPSAVALPTKASQWHGCVTYPWTDDTLVVSRTPMRWRVYTSTKREAKRSIDAEKDDARTA